MQKIIDRLNGLYAELVGILFWCFLPKQSDPTIPEPEPEPIEPEPEPIEPEPIEPEPVDVPNLGIFGLRLLDGWD